MKLKYLVLVSLCFTMVSCKLLICAAKTEKYLPDEKQQETKITEPIDTAKLILKCIVECDSFNTPKQPAAGGTTYYFTKANVELNWKYNGDTIIATIIRSGEANAAIPGYPKKIVNSPSVYKVYNLANGIYEAKVMESLYGDDIVNKFAY